MKKQVILAVVGLMFVGMTATMVNAGVTYGQTATKKQGDFNLSTHFSVEINGISVAGIQKAVGIDIENAITDFRTGEDVVNRTRPSKSKIVLTKAWSNTLEWYTWHKNVIDGKTDRRTVSIIFHDDAGKDIGRMDFFNCWPTKHVLPSASAANSGHLSETIELTFK